MRGKKDDRQDNFLDDGWPDEPPTEIVPLIPKDPVSEPTPEVGPGGDSAEVKKPMDQRSSRKDRKKKVQKYSRTPLERAL